MAAYLCTDENGIFVNRHVYDAWLGFQDLGEEVRLVREAAAMRGQLFNRREDVVCGWIRTALTHLDALHIPLPDAFDYPAELTPFLQRTIRPSTLGALRAAPCRQPVFIKPRRQAKRFDGQVIQPGPLPTEYDQHPDALEMWHSDVVAWYCEWRVYLLHGRILGMAPYRGDYRVAPDWDVVDAMRAAWTTAPAGCSMDIGVFTRADGSRVTALIECNEAIALGNYGLKPIDYARVLRARWDQLTCTTGHSRQPGRPDPL